MRIKQELPVRPLLCIKSRLILLGKTWCEVNEIYTYTWTTIVAVDNVSRRTRTDPSIRRSMTTMLTAQRGTSPDTWPMQRPDYSLWHQMLISVLGTSCVTILTAIVPSSGVSFILSLGTVSCPITQLIHGDTQARGWTGPLSWVTLPQYIIWRPDRCIIFINKRNQDCQKWKDLLSELRTGSLIPTRKWCWSFTKLWLRLSCQGHYCHFKSMLESWALRGVIWGLRGFLQPIL